MERFGICLVAVLAVFTPPTASESPPISTWDKCAAVRCSAGVCRVADGSIFCVTDSQLPPGVDDTCHAAKYMTTLLHTLPAGSGPVLYEAKTCKLGDDCGPMAACIPNNAFTGEGVCCAGKPDKPGMCPVEGPIGICGAERFCSNDRECPNSQKCCSSACGGSVCKNIVTDDCDVCVAGGDACVDNGLRCITTPCYSYDCRRPSTIVDACGGCDQGSLCYGGRCQQCPMRCGPNHECAFQVRGCHFCSQRIEPTCVPPEVARQTCKNGCDKGKVCVLKKCPNNCAGCKPKPICVVVRNDGAVWNF